MLNQFHARFLSVQSSFVGHIPGGFHLVLSWPHGHLMLGSSHSLPDRWDKWGSRGGLWKWDMLYAPNEQTSIPYIIWGFPEMGGTPIAGWFIMENTNLKWMRTGGTPMTQETSIKYTLSAVAVGGSEAIPMSDKAWDGSGSLVIRTNSKMGRQFWMCKRLRYY